MRAVAFYVTSHMTPCGVFHCLLIKELKDLQVVRNEGKIFNSRKEILGLRGWYD